MFANSLGQISLGDSFSSIGQFDFMQNFLYGDHTREIMEKAIEKHPTFSETITSSTQELYDGMGTYDWEYVRGTLNFDNPFIMLNDWLSILLCLVGGCCWLIAYTLIIYKGFKDKTAGMPLMVLGMNLAWEFNFAFVFDIHIPAQRLINSLWFFFDCVIVYLKFKYGRDEYHYTLPGMSDKLFYPYLFVVFIWGWACVFAARYDWNDAMGAYSAYIQNIFISATFVTMLYRKGNTKGQSMYIAIFKCLGTLIPDLAGAVCMVAYVDRMTGCGSISALMYALEPSFRPLAKILIFGCLFFDIMYIVCLYQRFKKEGRNPWTLKNDIKVPKIKEEAAI